MKRTPDLLDHLAKIEEMAADAQRSLQAGRSTTGVSHLAKIRNYAADARRHTLEDRAAAADAALDEAFHDDREARRVAGDQAVAEAFRDPLPPYVTGYRVRRARAGG